MATTEQNHAAAPVVTMGELAGLLRRRWRLVLGALLLGVLGAAVVASTTAPSYAAVATVDVTPSQGSGIDPKTVSTATEQTVVTSSAVARSAAATLNVQDPQQLIPHVSVSSPLNSLILNIRFTASSAQQAASGANAFAGSYVSYRQTAIQEQNNVRTAKIRAQLDPLQAQVNQLLSALAKLPSDPTKAQNPQATLLETQINAIQAQVNQLQQSLDSVQTSVVTAARLVGAAAPPESPSSPQRTLLLAIGLVLGLLVGTVVAVFRDRRDDRIRDQAQLRALTGLPVTADLTTLPRRRRANRAGLAALDADSADADAYRVAAVTLLSGLPETARSLVVLPAGAIGDDTVAANLAVTLAQKGDPIRLVSPHPALDGMTSRLHTGSAHEDATARTESLARLAETPSLRVVALDEGDAAVLNGYRHRPHKAEPLSGQAEFVVIDAAGVGRESSLLALIGAADRALVVVRQRTTRRADLTRLARQCAQLGTPIAGVILLPRRRRFTRAAASAVPEQLPNLAARPAAVLPVRNRVS